MLIIFHVGLPKHETVGAHRSTDMITLQTAMISRKFILGGNNCSQELVMMQIDIKRGASAVMRTLNRSVVVKRS